MISYSLHLGKDNNKTKKSRSISKELGRETNFANTSIQNLQQLSKVDHNNLRKYEDSSLDHKYIFIGSDNIVSDVKKIYHEEFDSVVDEYNSKQSREDRKIKDYFQKVSNDKQLNLAVEMIIQLGDMEFWKDKKVDPKYKKIIFNTYNTQLEDLQKFCPNFKIANAVVHFDGASPHLHIVGVPVIESNLKKGLQKKVGKATVFTKESLKELQDQMRERAIYKFNQFCDKFNCDKEELKEKEKGRTQYFKPKEYKELQNQIKELSDKRDLLEKTCIELESKKKKLEKDLGM